MPKTGESGYDRGNRSYKTASRRSTGGRGVAVSYAGGAENYDGVQAAIGDNGIKKTRDLAWARQHTDKHNGY